MPQTCVVDSRGASGALGSTWSEAEIVIAITLLSSASGTREMLTAPALPRDLLDARDQLVDRLLHRDLLADDAVHRLGPDILVVQNRELVVLGEIKRLGAAGELCIDRLAMAVVLPERALLALDGRRKPAAKRTFDIRPQ